VLCYLLLLLGVRETQGDVYYECMGGVYAFQKSMARNQLILHVIHNDSDNNNSRNSKQGCAFSLHM
jgi:hypothetical protein